MQRPFLMLFMLAFTLFAGDFRTGFAALGNGDYATALKELRGAAEKGDVRAQYNLAVMYDNGQGTERDLTEAARWYLAAASQGFPRAQYNIGNMYHFGEGVAQDKIRAYAWWSIGALQRNPDSRESRDMVAQELNAEEIARGKRLTRELIDKIQARKAKN